MAYSTEHEEWISELRNGRRRTDWLTVAAVALWGLAWGVSTAGAWIISGSPVWASLVLVVAAFATLAAHRVLR